MRISESNLVVENSTLAVCMAGVPCQVPCPVLAVADWHASGIFPALQTLDLLLYTRPDHSL